MSGIPTGGWFTLQWHITHRCNLRCSHCYQDDYTAFETREDLLRVFDQYEALLRAGAYKGYLNVTGGEPLTHPDLYWVLKEARRRGIVTGLLTNGTLIGRREAVLLRSCGVDYVQISLDGPPRVHDAIRGAGNCDRAMRGIDLLKQKNVRVLVSFTAQKSNAASFAALARLCRKHRVDKLWWDRVVTEGEEETARLAVTTEQFQRLVRTGNRLRERWRRPDGSSMVSNGRALQCTDFTRGTPYRCSAGENLLILLADGSLMPCRRLPFVIGNLRDGSMKKLVEESDVMRSLARPRVPQGCEGCRRLALCGGGARCVTYAQTGRLDLKDVNCFYY